VLTHAALAAEAGGLRRRAASVAGAGTLALVYGAG